MDFMLEKQFTATIYIIHNHQILLLFHKKLQKWLPPGGHLDPNELPCECAKREALEETGLEVEFITQENIWISQHNAKSFERPYLCLLEEIPAYKGVPAHQHIDFVYLGKPAASDPKISTQEEHPIRWFTLEDIEKLESELEIYEETKEMARHLFQAFIYQTTEC